MSIPGQLPINIGAPNNPANSDSLYTAFTTIQNNFTQLFSTSSPITILAAGNGIAISNSTSSAYRVTNTGVTSITGGNNVTITSLSGVPSSVGDLLITATGGGGNGGGVDSVGVVSNTLSVNNSPIINTGNIELELVTIGNVAGVYNNANLTVDQFGRVISATNGSSSGTVTSISVLTGDGLSVSGSPITTSGTITLNNTGVTSIVAGAGISVNQSNGAVTVTNTGGGSGGGGGTVTRVGVVSNTLNVSGSPILTSGNILIELPSNVSLNTLTANSIIGNQLQLNVSNSNVGFQITTASDSNLQIGIVNRKSKGTISVPTAISSTEMLLNFQSSGYTSYGVYQPGGFLQITANGNATNSGSYIPSEVRLNSTSATDIYALHMGVTGNVIIPGKLSQTLFTNSPGAATNTIGRSRGANVNTIANLQVGDYVLRTIPYGYTTNGTGSFYGKSGYSYAGEFGFMAVAIPTGTQNIPVDFIVRTVSTTYSYNTLIFSNTGNLIINGTYYGRNSDVTISSAGSFVGGIVSVTGNITGVNSNVTISRAGSFVGSIVSVTGNITGGNSSVTISNAASFTGNVVSITGNITGGNSNVVISNAASFTGNVVSVIGNIIGANSNVTISNASSFVGNIVSVTGNITGGNSNVVISNAASFTGNIVSVIGNIIGGNSDVTTSNAASFTGNVVSVIGNITGGNANLGNIATANYFAGTLTTNAQPNVTSVGILTALSVTGNANVGGLEFNTANATSNTTATITHTIPIVVNGITYKIMLTT